MNKHLTYSKRRFFSYEDRQAFATIARSLMSLDLVRAAKTAYWWMACEGWRYSPWRFYENYVSSSFDKKHGTDTTAKVDLISLDIESPNRDHGVYYQASPVYSTRRMLRDLPITFEDFCFIDFGSGKGRTLLLAAELPFRRVAGVEFSAELHACAKANIERFSNKTARIVESLHCDASAFEIPRDDVILYFFNPFDETVLAQVLANIHASLMQWPRRAYVIYHFLPDRELFAASGRFRVIRQWHRFIVYEWQAGPQQALGRT